MEEGWKRKRAEKLSPLTVVGETPRGERNVISRRFDGEPARHETFGCEHRERSLAPTSSTTTAVPSHLCRPLGCYLIPDRPRMGLATETGVGEEKKRGETHL